MNRCPWPYLENNPLYQAYHDYEWGNPVHDDCLLFEKLTLELFQSGLSWLTILKKRDHFREAFDAFDISKVSKYDQTKIAELLNNEGIIRHKRKIEATIHNASIIIEIQKEYQSFDQYIWSFSQNKILINESLEQKEAFSNKVYLDLKKRGFKHIGKVTTYSFLEAIGVMNNHAPTCFLNMSRK